MAHSKLVVEEGGEIDSSDLGTLLAEVFIAATDFRR